MEYNSPEANVYLSVDAVSVSFGDTPKPTSSGGGIVLPMIPG